MSTTVHFHVYCLYQASFLKESIIAGLSFLKSFCRCDLFSVFVTNLFITSVDFDFAEILKLLLLDNNTLSKFPNIIAASLFDEGFNEALKAIKFGKHVSLTDFH